MCRIMSVDPEEFDEIRGESETLAGDWYSV